MHDVFLIKLVTVRNRAKELVELLSDVEKIRTERRKAKANKHKYTGTGNDGFGGGGMSFSSGGSRYGGFGNDSLGYSGGASPSFNSGDRYGYEGAWNFSYTFILLLLKLSQNVALVLMLAEEVAHSGTRVHAGSRNIMLETMKLWPRLLQDAVG